MDFFEKNLREVLKTINTLIEQKISIVTTKRVREINKVKSDDRSKITRLWLALKYIKTNSSLLEKNGLKSPVNYKITVKEKFNIDNIISELKEKGRK